MTPHRNTEMKRELPRKRCAWASGELAIRYHHEEWGVPVHDDRTLFEFLIPEGAQAGLSWNTILNKRENYRKAFDGFDPERVARYDRRKIAQLLRNPGIVRNKLKIRAAVENAKAFLRVQREFGNFDRYIWQFVCGKPRVNQWKSLRQVPARTAESDAMSKDLKRRGFNFVGSTICYAFTQAVGMVNDQVVDCFRYQDLSPEGAAYVSPGRKPWAGVVRNNRVPRGTAPGPSSSAKGAGR
jgi:DNA-3-methyladenine glycosylase I